MRQEMNFTEVRRITSRCGKFFSSCWCILPKRFL